MRVCERKKKREMERDALLFSELVLSTHNSTHFLWECYSQD